MDDLDQLEAGSLKGALEAMLLVSTDPMPATDFARVLGVAPGEVVEALSDLSAEYADKGRGLALREVAGGWRLFTPPAYHDAVEKLVLSWDTRKLTQAALETLAVIAYLQPLTRDGVRAIRGVNSDGTISSLVDKGLVREVGRDTSPGQPILYGTTRRFLERFGLKSTRDLPPLEDFAPDEATRKFIVERLSGTSLGLAGEEEAPELLDEAVREGEVEAESEAEVEAGTDAAIGEAGAEVEVDAMVQVELEARGEETLEERDGTL